MKTEDKTFTEIECYHCKNIYKWDHQNGGIIFYDILVNDEIKNFCENCIQLAVSKLYP